MDELIKYIKQTKEDPPSNIKKIIQDYDTTNLKKYIEDNYDISTNLEEDYILYKDFEKKVNDNDLEINVIEKVLENFKVFYTREPVNYTDERGNKRFTRKGIIRGLVLKGSKVVEDYTTKLERIFLETFEITNDEKDIVRVKVQMRKILRSKTLVFDWRNPDNLKSLIKVLSKQGLELSKSCYINDEQFKYVIKYLKVKELDIEWLN